MPARPSLVFPVLCRQNAPKVSAFFTAMPTSPPLYFGSGQRFSPYTSICWGLPSCRAPIPRYHHSPAVSALFACPSRRRTNAMNYETGATTARHRQVSISHVRALLPARLFNALSRKICRPSSAPAGSAHDRFHRPPLAHIKPHCHRSSSNMLMHNAVDSQRQPIML